MSFFFWPLCCLSVFQRLRFLNIISNETDTNFKRQTRQRQNTSGSISDDIIDSINEPESDSTWYKNHEVFNTTSPLDKFIVGNLTRVVADILGDPHFVSQMSKMISNQVAVNLGKTEERSFTLLILILLYLISVTIVLVKL